MGLFASTKQRYSHDLSDLWSSIWVTVSARDQFSRGGHGLIILPNKEKEMFQKREGANEGK